MIIRTANQLDQVKDKIIELVNKGQDSLKFDSDQSGYWSNRNLEPNSSEILDSSKVKYSLF